MTSRASSMDGVPVPGSIVAGKYRVDRVLAAGGMGVVVAATHVQLQEPVALKVLHPRARLSPKAYARFVQEARAASRLRSEHVVRVFDLGALEDGAPYIAMELLEGENLAASVARGPLPVERAVDWLIEACEGVAAAHAHGIVHRDLKPANLFVTRRSDGSPCVKVLDFGVSKIAVGDDPPSAPARSAGDDASLTRTHERIGSPRYMSPEQVRADRGVGVASDVWALGAILHELLTGAPAFDAVDMDILCARIEGEEAPGVREVRPEIPEGLERVVLRCLRKDPAERFEDVGALALALAPYASARGVATAEGAALTLQQGPRAPISTAPASLVDTRAADDTAARSTARSTTRWSPGARRVVLATAAALAALAIAAAVPLVVRGRSHAALEGTPPGAPGARVRRSIAVDVREQAARPDPAGLAAALSELVASELRGGDALRVASVGPAEGGPPGADVVLRGTTPAQSGDELRMDVVLEDARGAALARFTERAKAGDPFALAARVAGRVRDELGVVPLTAAQETAARAAMPRTEEAARLYAAGLEAARRYDLTAARDALERATTADPDFAPAHSQLSRVLLTLGDQRRAREEARRAFERSAPLPRADQLAIEARLHRAENDHRAAADSMRVLFGFYPDDLDYGVELASDLCFSNDARGAFDVVARMHALPAPLGDDPRIDLEEALAAQVLGDEARQLAAARRAADGANRLGRRAVVAEASFFLASALQAQGKLAEARVAAEAARTAYDALGDRDGYGMATTTIATIALAAGDYAEAEAEQRRALDIFDAVGDRRHGGWGRHNLANTLAGAGDAEGALRVFDDAIARFREDGDERGVLACLSDSSTALVDDGRDEEAAARLDQAMPAIEAMRWDQARRGVLLLRARIHLHRGELAEAQRASAECVDSAHGEGDPDIEADCELTRAAVLREMDDLDHARAALDRARAIREETSGEADKVDVVRVALAELSVDAGDPRAAAAALAAVAERADAEKRAKTAWRARVALASAWLAAGDSRAADAAWSAARPARGVAVEEELAARLVGARLDAALGRSGAHDAVRVVAVEAENRRYAGLALACEWVLASAAPGGQRAARLAVFARSARARGYARLARLAAGAR